MRWSFNIVLKFEVEEIQINVEEIRILEIKNT